MRFSFLVENKKRKSNFILVLFMKSKDFFYFLGRGIGDKYFLFGVFIGTKGLTNGWLIETSRAV